MTYTYDDLGQLLSASNGYSYTYDNAGNLLTANGHTYTYGDADWADLLTAYDGQEITYDAIGNPTSYYNGTRWDFTWTQGRQLAEAATTSDAKDVTIAYTYDADGLRTGKTVTTQTYSLHTHSYTSTVVPASCIARGYTLHACACGDTFKTNYTASLGHDMADGVCTRCGYEFGGGTISPVEPTYPIISTSTEDELTEDAGIETASTEADLRTLESTVVTAYEYICAGTELVRMVVTTTVDDGTPTVQTLDFAYDASGMPVTVTTGGSTYYYITNLQGDVMALVDSTGATVTEYSYDPYGNVLTAEGDLAEINPLTYRGYVYDTETTLYYLQSRYYDPESGRFINADALISTGQGILGNNMFAYCINNPVCMVDSSGRKPGDLFDTIDEAAEDAACYLNEDSIENNTEYAVAIYTVETVEDETVYVNFTFLWWTIDFSYEREVCIVQYTYDEPITGSSDGVLIPTAPESTQLAALFHTHGAYDPMYHNDNFSYGDYLIAHDYKVPIYVATPSGSLRRYDPSDRSNTLICGDIPYDPNHPLREAVCR